MTGSIKISIITPAHQAFDGLLRVYNKIRGILSAEVIWYIKDSGKCERTASYFMEKEHVTLDMRPDDGIYDAINVAIETSQSRYYLVLGADDLINIDVFKLALSRLVDSPGFLFQFYRIKLSQSQAIVPYKKLPLKWSNASIMPSHSAGTIISRVAHDRFGLYSTEFKILGDAYFVLKAIHNGASYVRYDEVLGSFELGGISSAPSWLRVREWYLYQSKVFGNRSLVLYLFFSIRVIQLMVSLIHKK